MPGTLLRSPNYNKFSAMEFNAELLGFQGAMLSADNLSQFSKLTSAGGNEENIHTVLSVIHKFFREAEYIDENGLLIASKEANIRKIAMFIILNTDLPVLEDMVDHAGLESIIWSIPTIPKHLMCEIIWRLGMEKFAYEIIQQSWPQLGLEVAEAFLVNFKYLKPNECLDRLYNLSASCYILICRLTYLQIGTELLSKTLVFATEILQKFLRYYTAPPNRHVLEILRTDETYKFEGLRLKSILFLVDKCLNVYAQSTNVDAHTIYKLTYNEHYVQDPDCEICNSSNQLEVDCLLNCNIFLLDIFQQIVMGVSVDMFCAWSEFEDEGMSMQQAIGEICDRVYTSLQSINSVSEHPVCSMIKVMARKPTKISDIINSMDSPAILEKINSNDKQSIDWIHALVNKEDLCSDLQLVQVIKSNIKVFDHQECFALFNTFNNAAATAGDNEEFLHHIKIELFAGCSITDKQTILKEHFKGNRFKNCKWFAEDFDYILVEVFNKLVNEVDVEPDYSHVLTLFYQHPQKVYAKIFSLAEINTLLITPMCQLMELLKDYHDGRYADHDLPVVFLITKFIFGFCTDNTDKEVITSFVIELKNRGILEGSQILMSAVLPCLYKATRSKSLKKINVLVNLLHTGFTTEELSEYKGPILMIIAQIMEVTRLRTLKTYHPDAIKTLNKVLLWQKHLMDAYKDNMPELCRLWLKGKLLEGKLHPLNLYYYKPLWKRDRLSFFESVTEHSIREATSLNIITLQLIQILPWTTLEEWLEIWDNLVDADIPEKQVLGLFHKVMTVLIKTFNKYHTQAIFSCLYNCYHQLMYITRFKFFKEPLTNVQVETCLHFMRRDFKIIQPIDVIELEQVTMSILVYLSCMKEHYTVDVPKWFENTSLHAAALLYVGSPSQ